MGLWGEVVEVVAATAGGRKEARGRGAMIESSCGVFVCDSRAMR